MTLIFPIKRSVYLLIDALPLFLHHFRVSTQNGAIVHLQTDDRGLQKRSGAIRRIDRILQLSRRAVDFHRQFAIGGSECFGLCGQGDEQAAKQQQKEMFLHNRKVLDGKDTEITDSNGLP